MLAKVVLIVVFDDESSVCFPDQLTVVLLVGGVRLSCARPEHKKSLMFKYELQELDFRTIEFYRKFSLPFREEAHDKVKFEKCI